MDPETQKLIEKTRQRREMLNQRIAGMPEAAPRKRRTPVHEQETENVLAEKQINQDDSPKRQCVREGEPERKQDTPAIRGVQSRIRDLPNSLTRENDENMEGTPTPKPRKSMSSPPLERRAAASLAKSPARDTSIMSSTVSSTRKGRFAALANHISSWEDDLTHHVIHKEEEKKPRWQPPVKTDSALVQQKSASSGKGPAPPPPPALETISPAVTFEAHSPKKSQDPSPRTPASPAASLTRNSPLRTSKVEWNRSPKPFSSSYGDSVSSPSKSAAELARFNSPKTTPKKAASETVVVSPSASRSGKMEIASETVVALPPLSGSVNIKTNRKGLNDDTVLSSATASLKTLAAATDTSSGLAEAASSNDPLNMTLDEPTLKPVSQRLASWAKKVDATKPPAVEPSRQPLSAKLASFEKKIAQNTPKASQTRSPFVSKTPKKANTLPVSTPTASASSGQKSSDPVELPVFQRMSRMQEKLSNTPQLCPRPDEPTAFSVGARMSAWENTTSSNLVSDIKKVNPVEGTPVVIAARPKSEFTPKSASLVTGPPQNPPPPPALATYLSAKKSFRECIEEKASQVLSKKEVSSVTSPAKIASPVKAGGSPCKIVHSPSKVSAGTKMVQERLVSRVQDSNTTCSSLAAQSRAARFAELEEIHSRWKNGVLRDDSSSDESGKSSEEPGDRKRGQSPKKADVENRVPSNSKREESRNRVRVEFNQKLAEIGFGGTNTASPVPPPPPPPPQEGASAGKSAPSTTGASQTSSIYNLIKKRDDAVIQCGDNKKVQFEDSFDDTDDDCQRRIPQSAVRRLAQQQGPAEEDLVFKKPQVPKLQVDSESEALSSSDAGDEEFGQTHLMDIDDDDISLKGFVSEAVRRESILPSPKPHGSSQSSQDSYDDDGLAVDSEKGAASSAKHTGYNADDDSNNESEDRHVIDDLLDEAFDDTSDDADPDMDPRNVVLRRKQEPDSDYDPDMDINNVVMRKKATAAPVPAQRHHARSTDSSDDDVVLDRPYSLEAYRKSAVVHQHVVEPVIRKSRYAGAYVQEEDVVMPTAPQQPQRDDKRAVLDRIRELQELVQQEQSVIMQTSNALNKCCVGNAYFAGSAEQVECNRVLLIACQKRQCYMTEIQRLKDTGILSHEGPGPQGSLTISDIRLPLKKEFVTKIGTSQDTTTHYFILLIRNGPQLICTQMLSTHDPMMRGSLDFPNLIKINGITANFKLTMDIYSMSVSREVSSKDKKKKTPKKTKGYAMALESPGGPTAVRTTSFSQVTSVMLTMKCLDKNSFHLDRLPHLSPLYGQIFMRLKCLMESNVEERGFLTMFEDVSGFGAWHRRWCVLASNKICVWKYPDDETRKDPMTLIDLKRCITEKVGLIPRDICARPNTFELTTVRQPLKGEHDTLITRTHNSTTSVRHQMSADSKEERIVWCNKINRTLANLRTWNADALKPQKNCTPSASYR